MCLNKKQKGQENSEKSENTVINSKILKTNLVLLPEKSLN